jgi:AraC-like DNA-binding protein
VVLERGGRGSAPSPAQRGEAGDRVHVDPGYREGAPPPALRQALACLWVRVVPPHGAPRTRVLPDACVDLVWQAGRGAFVAGPDTGPRQVEARPGSVFVGARLLPGAGGPALRLPLDDLRDLRVDVGELWPELEDRLNPALAPAAALERIGALAARLVTSAPPDAAVREAARRLAEPRARVRELPGDLGLSERQLRRRCKAAVGYGPKTLHRVVRFRRFLSAADAGGPAPDLARIALDAGYADQAHLTRECSRLSGLAPAALMRARAGGV